MNISPNAQRPASTESRFPKIEFWWDFASTYSYLSAMRVEHMAEERQVEVVWRPFLLGPIFKKQGKPTSPFNLNPAKGRYMWQDMARQCKKLGLPLTVPDPFPQNSLLATRIAHVGRDASWLPDFARGVFQAEFGEGADISDPQVLSRLVQDAGADPEDLLAQAVTDGNKISLRQTVEEAEHKGIFGAPSFVTEDGSLFWGFDRMADAFDAALTPRD
ncbi:2-hydroxychromene-2-carboxylate isomerase [Roseibium sp. RKSG952]|uniref:2-hydroxychromene-2-carboxylate isomerase n=1 Tax=Roseibium sp. RKSG952 TaxID=2529384 RepID=UPI0012BCDE6F|nr:2-hydroxychromene-2-carboxylate isomerase [Roseibium sp. RKSG952]MTH98212.1 2-hydroxychromene-2-carboxylate isomerase [Roseibium sp. RKSG952]